MRAPTVFFAVFHLLVVLVASHPFIIVSTKVTDVRVLVPRPTAHFAKRQGILDTISSLIGGDEGDDESTTTAKATSTKATSTKATVTLVPPAVASTTSAKGSQSTSTESEDESTTSTSEESSTSTSTSSSESSTTDVAPTTTTTSAASTSTAASTPTVAAQATNTASLKSSSDDDNSGMPPGGTAVAVIMSLLIVAVIAWLIFKYHPKSRAWWAARQQKKFQERSHRDGIDGPKGGAPTLRQAALGGDSNKRRTMLKSFFAPAMVDLGNGQAIKKKPVNWGVESPATPSSPGLMDIEKAPMALAAAPMGRSPPPPVNEKALPSPTAMSPPSAPSQASTPVNQSEAKGLGIQTSSMSASAAPMGQIERYSIIPPLARAPPKRSATTTTQPISPVSLRPRESLENMGAVSPMTIHTKMPSISGLAAERDLPALPPVPVLPQLIHAKRGSDGVFKLNRA